MAVCLLFVVVPCLIEFINDGEVSISPYGVCEHQLEQKDAIKISEAGIKWLRIDFTWDKIEPSQGCFDFSKYDEIVTQAKAYGIELLPILDYCAGWATSAPGGSSDKDATRYPPKEMSYYKKFVYETVNHFKSDIQCWEIWNEENLGKFWKPKPYPVKYIELLKAGYEGAKEADPNCIILLGGLAPSLPTLQADTDFLRIVYEAGGKPYFDRLAVHPYVLKASNIPSVLDQYHQVMINNGDSRKKIWITEVGWPTKGPIRVSETTQAEYLEETFTKCLALDYIEKIFWYELRNGGTSPFDREQNFGILRWDYSEKPAYLAYKQLTSKKCQRNHGINLGIHLLTR